MLGCGQISGFKAQEAQSMYNAFGTVLARGITPEEGRKMFGCHYRPATDEIYSYKTFWGKKFILVRYGNPLTYYDGD